ncbi:MAG: outer membrane protein [Nitrospiraceae bacterium]
MSRWQIGCLVATCVLSVSSLAQAEIYAGGFGGISLPSGLSTGAAGNIKLENNPSFGIKGGFYMPSTAYKWLGLEAELYQAFPDIKKQTLPSNPGSPFSGSIPITKLSVTTVAINALMRIPGETIQPYAGIGVGVSFANMSEGVARSESAFAPTFNLLGGVRGYVTKRVALFGEFKYSLSEFSFTRNNVSGAYTNNMFVAGITFHISGD